MLLVIDSVAISALLRRIPTSQKRINARQKFREICCDAIDEAIKKEKDLLRSLRSESESVKRGVYENISRLEIEKMKVVTCKDF